MYLIMSFSSIFWLGIIFLCLLVAIYLSNVLQLNTKRFTLSQKSFRLRCILWKREQQFASLCFSFYIDSPPYTAPYIRSQRKYLSNTCIFFLKIAFPHFSCSRILNSRTCWRRGLFIYRYETILFHKCSLFLRRFDKINNWQMFL